MDFDGFDGSANAKRPHGRSSGRRGHASAADEDHAAAPPTHGGARRRGPPDGAVPSVVRTVAAGPGGAARATAARRPLRAAGRRGRRGRCGAGRAPRAISANARRAGRWSVAATGRHAGRRLRAPRATLRLRLHRRPREAQTHPAAARTVAARAQMPAPRVAGQWRNMALHAAALQNHERSPQSYDDVSSEFVFPVLQRLRLLREIDHV